MTTEEYKSLFDPEDDVGMDAIDSILQELYPKKESVFFQPTEEMEEKGLAPLEAVAMYEVKEDGKDYLHFISYGFSNLYYDEERAQEEFSGFGFELTFRLKNKTKDCTWVCGVMQNLALYVFDQQTWFEPYSVIPAGGPICLDEKTEITAIAFVLDPELKERQTPNGKVQFLQMVGLTTKEYESIEKNPTQENIKKLIENLKKDNPLLLTDLSRK